jgi:cell volume regulation protein A
VPALAGTLGLELPPRPEAPIHAELDLPGTSERSMAAYTVQPFSMAARRRLDRMKLPTGIAIVSIIRDGTMQKVESISRLAPNDYVLVIAQNEQMATLDRLFAAGLQRSGRSHREEMLGEFVLDGNGNLGAIADLYEFPVPDGLRHLSVGRFMRLALGGKPRPGSRLHVGEIDLTVRAVDEGRIVKIGLDPDPPISSAGRRQLHGLRIWLLAAIDTMRQWLPGQLRME